MGAHTILGGAGIFPAQQMVLVQATYVLWRLLCDFETIECRDEEERYVDLARMLLESRKGAKIALVRNAREKRIIWDGMQTDTEMGRERHNIDYASDT